MTNPYSTTTNLTLSHRILYGSIYFCTIGLFIKYYPWKHSNESNELNDSNESNDSSQNRHHQTKKDEAKQRGWGWSFNSIITSMITIVPGMYICCKNKSIIKLISLSSLTMIGLIIKDNFFRIDRYDTVTNTNTDTDTNSGKKKSINNNQCDHHSHCNGNGNGNGTDRKEMIIDNRKLQWNIFIESNDGRSKYVIQNMYYLTMKFYFDNEKMMADFRKLLSEKNEDDIDYMYDNPIYTRNIQNDFIKIRNYMQLFQLSNKEKLE